MRQQGRKQKNICRRETVVERTLDQIRSRTSCCGRTDEKEVAVASLIHFHTRFASE